MKIEITERKEVKRTIDVEFPYYYQQYIDTEYSQTTIYGKIISKDKEVTIDETETPNGFQYQIEEDFMSNCYFSDKHKSTEQKFEDVKSRALNFLNDF